MKQKPIGVFDSGVGGLTAVRELKKILPHEDIVYFGDTGRVPYGTKSRETIEMYAKQSMDFLLSKDVKMIIAACGTVSSVAVNAIADLKVPFTGVVKPASAAAARITRSGNVGVIGTPTTVKSSSYEKEIHQINGDIKVFSKACPLFVPLVENGFVEEDNEATNIICRKYLDEFKDKNIDTLILGCTHFPLISQIISNVVGKDVKLIDSGKEAVKDALQLLKERNLLNDEIKEGKHSYYVSDSVQNFVELAWVFLGEEVKDTTEKIQLGVV